jgi:hypothetical protein
LQFSPRVWHWVKRLTFFNRIFTAQNAAVTNPTQAKCYRAQDPVLALYKTKARQKSRDKPPTQSNRPCLLPATKAVLTVSPVRTVETIEKVEKSERSKQSALSTAQDRSACANKAGDALCAFWLRAAAVTLFLMFEKLSDC